MQVIFLKHLSIYILAIYYYYYYLNHVYRKIFFDLFKIQNRNMAIENLEKHFLFFKTALLFQGAPLSFFCVKFLVLEFIFLCLRSKEKKKLDFQFN
jgi:hypothetical protein